jgi:mannose-1-phosphate guanylyltransferase
MEKASNIAVLPGDFGWSDVGSFAAIPEVRPADENGNVISGAEAVVVDCKGCVVLAEKRPLTVVGLTDMVVVDSGDAVLVVPKDKSQDVRKVVEALKARKREKYL